MPTTPDLSQSQQSTNPASVLMVMNGQTAYVPVSQAENAIGQGGELGVRMTDSQGNKAVVPFSQQDAAQKNGANWDVTPENDATKAYMTWRQQAIANRPTDLLGRPANVPLTPPENIGTGPTISARSNTGTKLNSIPLARKLFDAVNALDDAANFTEKDREQHPIQAELATVADRMKGFLFGGAANPSNNIGTGQYGMLTNPVTAGLIPGAEGSPAAAEAIEGGVNALKSGAAAIRGAVGGAKTVGEAVDEANAATHVYDPATKTINPIQKIKDLYQQVRRGEDVAQGPAQSALRTSVQEAAADESMANNVAANKSLRTSLEEPIDTFHSQAKTLYKQIDDAAGTDFKALNDKLANTNYQLRQLTETEEDMAKEGALEKSRVAIMDKLAAAKQDALDNGVTPETLDKADQSFRQAEAMKDLEAKVFKNPSVVQGNARFGSSETVDVNKAVVQLQKLQDKTEFGSSRLEQALGPDAAKNLLSNIYKAQRSGKTALKTQQIAKWAGITLGGATAAKGLGALAGALSGSGQ